MSSLGFETVEDPFTAFAFEVILALAVPVPGVSDPVCHGAFSECDGLEISIEPKSVADGGANTFRTHLVGPARYGQLTLRRGMTSNGDLWAWMAAVRVPGRDTSAHGTITMRDGTGRAFTSFTLEGCLPTRVRGPALNAQTGLVAVEELGLVVGRLTLGAGGAVGAGLGIGVGVGFSASIGASAGAGVSAQVSGGLGLSGQLGGTFSAGASAGFGVG
jgi:phage tail-like protein